MTFVDLLKQALEFLNAHRDTIVILLKIDLEDIPLAVVDEINLLVSISTAILPLVPKSELVCILHIATLRLLTMRCFSSHLLDMAASIMLSLRWRRRLLETVHGLRASGHQPTQSSQMPLLTTQLTATKQGLG